MTIDPILADKLTAIEETQLQILAELTALGERIPEPAWYCPAETGAQYANRTGAKGVPDGYIVCEGGYRLYRHGGRAAEKKHADQIWHPLPGGRTFGAEHLGETKTVKAHNVWKSKALTAEEAIARGLTLRDVSDEDDVPQPRDRAERAPRGDAGDRAAPAPQPREHAQTASGKGNGAAASVTSNIERLVEWAAERYGVEDGDAITGRTLLDALDERSWVDVIAAHDADWSAIAAAAKSRMDAAREAAASEAS